MVTSISVDEMFLPRYMNTSTNFRGLPLKMEMALFCWKHMYSVLFAFTWMPMPPAASSRLCRPLLPTSKQHWSANSNLQKWTSNFWKTTNQSFPNICISVWIELFHQNEIYCCVSPFKAHTHTMHWSAITGSWLKSLKILSESLLHPNMESLFRITVIIIENRNGNPRWFAFCFALMLLGMSWTFLFSPFPSIDSWADWVLLVWLSAQSRRKNLNTNQFYST